MISLAFPLSTFFNRTALNAILCSVITIVDKIF